MTPNQITLLRVLLAFLAVALFAAARTPGAPHLPVSLLGVTLIIAAIVLDAVDGYVARRKMLATPLGAQLDILGDRVIENVLFTFFAVTGLISLWVPVIFFVRGTATDFVRSLGAREGRHGFGRGSMLETRWGKAIVASRASRASYGILKCVCFCYLGLQLAVLSAPAASQIGRIVAPWTEDIIHFGDWLVLLTVGFCLLRGLPVLWESRPYLVRLTAGPVGTPSGVVSR